MLIHIICNRDNSPPLGVIKALFKDDNFSGIILWLNVNVRFQETNPASNGMTTNTPIYGWWLGLPEYF